MAKVWDNPDVDVDGEIAEFFRMYFGPAAEPMNSELPAAGRIRAQRPAQILGRHATLLRQRIDVPAVAAQLRVKKIGRVFTPPRVPGVGPLVRNHSHYECGFMPRATILR